MVTDELQINITADTGNAAQNINNTANALNNLGEAAKTSDSDMSELVRAMSEAASNMVTISQNIASSAAGLGGFQSSVDAVSSALTGINIKFDVLNGSLQQSYLAFDGAAASVQGLSAASEASAAGLNSIVSATDGFASRMDALSDTTHGTTAGMVSLQKEIQDTLTTMRGFADNMGAAGKDAEDASRKIKELSEQVSTLAKQSSAGNTAVMSLAAGFKSLKGIVATLGIGKFIKDSNDAYIVQMQNELKLTAHMKQRMNATDDEIQSIKELASAQQQLGVIGDEIQLAGAQQLTTYARQSSTLKTLLPAMNNLIAQNAGYEASVGDATSAADMLGRALNGQYTSLRRMGVTFTQAQEQVLKYGTESQKASVLADAINSKVGNMNQLLAQTPTGQLKQLQNDFGDLQEEIGATFQPLITSLVPVLRGVMDTLAVPIKNVSTGITIIGQAIASIDSPAVRAIGLAAAGIAVMSKLKALMGGTAAGLLILGVALSGIIGSMQTEQESIGNIVSDAYANATAATGQATDAAKDYKEQLEDVQKTANRLAGFDTITKLSGGSSGSLASSLFSESDIDGLNDLEDAAYRVTDAFDDIKTPEINFDFTSALDKAGRFASDLDFIFKHWGDDEAMYKPLTRLTSQIEEFLNANGFDGTAFVNFWKGVGNDVYDALTGDDSGIYNALKDIDSFLQAFNIRWKIGAIDLADSFAKSLYAITHAKEIVSSGQGDASAQAIIDSMPNWNGVRDLISVWYNNSELKDKLKSFDTSEYDLSEFGYLVNNKLREGLNSDDALQAAKDIYLNTSAAQNWYYNIVDPRDRLSWADVEIRRNQLLQSGEISSSAQPTSYTDIPVRPSGMPSNVPEKNITVNAFFDGELREANRVEHTNGGDQ